MITLVRPSSMIAFTALPSVSTGSPRTSLPLGSRIRTSPASRVFIFMTLSSSVSVYHRTRGASILRPTGPAGVKYRAEEKPLDIQQAWARPPRRSRTPGPHGGPGLPARPGPGTRRGAGGRSESLRGQHSLGRRPRRDRRLRGRGPPLPCPAGVHRLSHRGQGRLFEDAAGQGRPRPRPGGSVHRPEAEPRHQLPDRDLFLPPAGFGLLRSGLD